MHAYASYQLSKLQLHKSEGSSPGMSPICIKETDSVTESNYS